MHYDGSGLRRQAAMLAQCAQQLRDEQRALVTACARLGWRSPAAAAFGREAALLLASLSEVADRLEQLATGLQAHDRTAQHRAFELQAAANVAGTVLAAVAG